MKFTTALISAVALAISASSLPVRRDVPTDLIPEFGFSAGVNPTGTGNCDGAVNGANGKPVEVPCACPPDRQTFINSLNANVAAGHAVHNPTVDVSFPTDDSKASQLARINTALVTLQNLNGPGQGCPAASTTFVAQQKAIQDGTAAAAGSTGASSGSAGSSSPAAAAPAAKNSATAAAAASTSTSAVASGAGIDATIAAVAPQLGGQAGKNPNGSGSCDGAVNGANGQPVLVPCACPPDSNTYLAALSANVAAGHAIHNPTVQVSYPLDDSVASKQARITAASITIQNLNGPGQGCPIAATTLQAQSKALGN